MNALLSPPILFFILGLLATVLRTGLRIPHPIPKLLSLYLLFAIGFKGGLGLRESGPSMMLFSVLIAGIALSVIIALWSFIALRKRLNTADAGAVAATYGSVSAVTFITASTILHDRGIDYSGHMVAVMALMESPAIIIAVVLIRLNSSGASSSVGGTETSPRRIEWGPLLHESFLNGPVFLLLGSMVVGMLTGERGAALLKPFAADAFIGILCFFLLDLGLLAARRLRDLKDTGLFCLLFCIVAPIINAGLGMAAAWLIGLGLGDTLLLMILAGSASYLAVPATMRLVVPEANTALFVPMALGITFPFNVAMAIPAYLWFLERFWI